MYKWIAEWRRGRQARQVGDWFPNKCSQSRLNAPLCASKLVYLTFATRKYFNSSFPTVSLWLDIFFFFFTSHKKPSESRLRKIHVKWLLFLTCYSSVFTVMTFKWISSLSSQLLVSSCFMSSIKSSQSRSQKNHRLPSSISHTCRRLEIAFTWESNWARKQPDMRRNFISHVRKSFEMKF